MKEGSESANTLLIRCVYVWADRRGDKAILELPTKRPKVLLSASCSTDRDAALSPARPALYLVLGWFRKKRQWVRRRRPLRRC